MSLINQVLKDLEQRRGGDYVVAGQVTEGLVYTSFSRQSHSGVIRKRIFIFIAGLLLLTTLITGLYYFYDHLSVTASMAETHGQSQLTAQPLKTQDTVQTTQSTVPAPYAQVEIASNNNKQRAGLSKETVVQTKQLPAVSIKRQIRGEEISLSQNQAKGTVEKRQRPITDKQRAALAYQAGYKAVQQRHYQQAEKILYDAIRYVPEHIKARELLAGMYIKTGRWLEAGNVLKQGLQYHPRHLTFIKLLARSLMQQQQDSEAIQLLQARAPKVAADPEYHALLAALYQRSEQHQAAAKTYAQILKVRPNAGLWWVGMAISLEALGNTKQALAAYQQARRSGTLHGNIKNYTDNRLLALKEIDYPIE